MNIAQNILILRNNILLALKKIIIIINYKTVKNTKMPIDYSKGKIYAIRSHQTVDVYIGSTCQLLCERLSGHRKYHKQVMNGKKENITSIKIIQYPDHYIELIEHFPCNTKEELMRREGEIIRQTVACINKNIAGRTQKEYIDENQDKIRNMQAEYYLENTDKIKEQTKKYYEENKEKILETKATYYEENHDNIRFKNAKYYEENHAKLLEMKAKYYEKK